VAAFVVAVEVMASSMQRLVWAGFTETKSIGEERTKGESGAAIGGRGDADVKSVEVWSIE
jgi:hypothetical protein